MAVEDTTVTMGDSGFLILCFCQRDQERSVKSSRGSQGAATEPKVLRSSSLRAIEHLETAAMSGATQNICENEF